MALTPVTRDEHYLAKAGGQDVPTPSPVPREEQYLAKLSGQDVIVSTPTKRREKFLYAASGGDIELPSEDKMRRIEKFMAKAGGRDVTTPTAVTREEQFWDAIIAESGIKTLTGRLPIFFRTSERKLRDWIIYGNNEPGKNLVIANVGATISGITFTVDSVTGTVTANGTATGSAQLRIGINNPDEPNNTTVPPGNYYFSGCPSGGSSNSYNCYSWDYDTVARSKQWDGTTNVETDIGRGNCQVQINGHRQSIILRIVQGYTANNIVFEPMLRKANTNPDFEPYKIGIGERTESGYVLNIGVGFAPISSADPAVALITRKTIYIGESPLTEGQTLSMSEFGDIETQPYADMFIAAFEGFNYDDQLSYNQPRMRIKYKEYKE